VTVTASRLLRERRMGSSRWAMDATGQPGTDHPFSVTHSGLNVLGKQLLQLVEQCVSLLAGRFDGKDAAVRCRQRHQVQDRFGVHVEFVELNSDIALELAGALDDSRARDQVQPLRQVDRYLAT